MGWRGALGIHEGSKVSTNQEIARHFDGELQKKVAGALTSKKTTPGGLRKKGGPLLNKEAG